MLAAKRVMYAVEYRRFYLRDLESIVVWPSPVWLLRPIILAVLFGALGAVLWLSVNFAVGAILGGVGLTWAALELVRGPTAKSRIRTSGATVDVSLVTRTRRAHKVLAKIDAAVQTVRGPAIDEADTPVGGPQATNPPTEATSEAAPTVASLGDLT